MLDSIPDLLSYLDGDERNVVLTFVRIWTTIATGVIRSKDGAADWALPLLPPEHQAVLNYARANYLDGAPEEWGHLLPRVRPFVDYVIGEIETAAARPLPRGSGAADDSRGPMVSQLGWAGTTSNDCGSTANVRAMSKRAPSRTCCWSGTKRWTIGNSTIVTSTASGPTAHRTL